MTAPKIVLPGAFEDAFLYMDKLLLLTEDWTVRVLSLRALATRLQESVPDAYLIGPALFTRNDSVRSIATAIPTARAQYEALVNASETDALVIEPEQLEESHQDLGIDADVVLDWEIYNRRLYIGSNMGLDSVDFTFDDVAEPISELHRRTDARIVSLNTRYWTVHASAGDDGLLSSFDDFRLLPRDNNRQLVELAPHSVRSSWFGDRLVNYRAHNLSPDLLDTVFERVPNPELMHAEDDPRVATAAAPADELSGELERTIVEQGAARGEIEYVFNSGRAFFMKTGQAGISTLSIRIEDDHVSRVTSRDYGRDARTILKMVTAPVTTLDGTQPGILIEHEDSTELFVSGNFVGLFDGPALSVRTFPRSQWYQHLAAVVTEHEVVLCSLSR